MVLCFSSQQQKKVVKGILQKKKERKVKDSPREKEREHAQREPVHTFEEWECFLTSEVNEGLGVWI